MTELPVLEGFRLRLRAPTKADSLTLFNWYNDPETVAPFDRFSVDAFEEFEASIRDAPNNPRSLAPRFVVERRSDNRILGFVGYYRSHPVLELTDVWYVLGERTERGKGFGSEAVGLLIDYLFHAFELARVGATVDVDNVPSYRLLERIGMRREGTMRTALFHHNGWHDVAIYGVTRKEWSGRTRQE